MHKLLEMDLVSLTAGISDGSFTFDNDNVFFC